MHIYIRTHKVIHVNMIMLAFWGEAAAAEGSEEDSRAREGGAEVGKAGRGEQGGR